MSDQRQPPVGSLPNLSEAVSPPITGDSMGNTAAAPRPATIWPIHSISTRVPVAAPAPGVRTPIVSPAAIMIAPPTSRRLRPNRSPSAPKFSRSECRPPLAAAGGT